MVLITVAGLHDKKMIKMYMTYINESKGKYLLFFFRAKIKTNGNDIAEKAVKL